MGAQSRGLTAEQAARALAEQGPNELRQRAPVPRWRVVLRQFESPLVLILVAAALIAAALGDLADGAAISVIIVLNAIIGYAQEQRAERAMAALRELTAPRARVRRAGVVASVAAREIVVGDLLVLEAGDVVAADARVSVANALQTNEAALTGESLPVDKWVRPSGVEPAAALADRHGSVFMGTAIAGGSGEAVVEATGMATQIGHIAELLAEARDESTPLQRRLDRLGHILLLVCAVLVALVAGIGALHGMGIEELFMASVSMAVAAVPEGLPAIITIALALGMQRMAAQRVLVRRLAAVETLGSVTVICTDKTGTLTTGIMSVRELWTPSGAGERELLWGAAACCDAQLYAPDHETGKGEEGSGDTTELAMLRAARAQGIEREDIEREQPRVAVQPFSPARRRMSIARRSGGQEGAGEDAGAGAGEGEGEGEGETSGREQVWVKGAVETLVELLEPRARARAEAEGGALEVSSQMAARGLRVLAVARGDGREERELELLGLVAMADPPREAAREAIAADRSAVIRTVMITGDHPVTATAIARELGLVSPEADAEEIAARVRARTTARDKNRVVEQLREAGEIVAMTGDGVNDAPAIRAADVGLAMGETATEVTREAADLVLVDDDLSSVITAIREGRVIYNNIQKTIVYLLSGNFSELIIMLVAAAAGMPFPLLPLQLLWINLVTEPLPGLALVVDPPDQDVLAQPPRDPSAPLLGRREWAIIGATALVQTVVGFGVYYWALELEGRTVADARSLAFMTVACSELLRSFAFRSPTRLLWQVGALRNLTLAGVVAGSMVLQLLVFRVGPVRAVFGVELLAWADVAVVVGLSFIPVSVLESAKLVAWALRRGRGREGEDPSKA